MSTKLNSAGVAHAKSLIKAGKVNQGAWSFSAADGNALLGAKGDDWANYGKWHLALHPDATENTKAHYGYPFGKNGEVYWLALTSAKGYAAQQGDTAIEDACTVLLDMIKPPKKDADVDRIYSVFEIKSFDEESRTFKGIATTPQTDRVGDIVEPLGGKFKLPLPMLWQHGRGSISDPVGWITSAIPGDKGIAIEGKVAKPKDDYPTGLRDDLNKAWVMVRDKLVRGLSIGFRSLKSEPIDAKDPWGGIRFLEWEWLELSPVSIPANAGATIQSIKSYDEQQRAASGASRVVRLNSPGASGTQTQTGAKMNLKQQIEQFEAKEASLKAAQETIMTKAAEEVRTLDDEEKTQYDDATKELKDIGEHLVRLRAHLETQLANAASVNGSGEHAGTQSRGASGQQQDQTPGRVVHGMRSRLEPGVRFARYAMCIGAAKGNVMQAEMISRRFLDSSPEVNLALKAAVAAGTTQDATWASPLVQLQEMQQEFIEFLRPKTIIGRIPTLRRVPFNIKFTRQTAGTSGTFVGEGLPKPLGKMDFELLSLTWAKAATIIVMTEELLRFSNPNSEVLARDDLAAGIQKYVDARFVDPVYAGVANVSPASITNGITPIPSLGTTVALITDTCALALSALVTAELDPSNFVWIMNPTTALSLSLKRTSQDVFAFPGITALGGTFLGYPVVTSNSVALSGSPTESFVILCDPTNIMLADDGGVSIDMSTEASLQMDSAPSAGAAQLVSLWQNNLVGLRAERFINWRRRRDTAVAVITMNVKW